LRRFLYRTLIEAEQRSTGLGPDRMVSDREAQTASLRYRRRDDLSLSLCPYPWIQVNNSRHTRYIYFSKTITAGLWESGVLKDWRMENAE
jgi:hypothetical protein